MRRGVRQIRIAGASILSLTAFLLVAGCASTTDRIRIDYLADPSPARIPGAQTTMVEVEVTDSRRQRDRVSAKKNAYGQERGAIVAEEDVPTTVRQAIEAELGNRGFILAAPGVGIVVELQRFWNDFELGFWSGTASAEVSLIVQVKRRDGAIAFVRAVRGRGVEPHVQINGGHNAKAALDRALKDAVGPLMSDEAFLAAVVRAGRREATVGSPDGRRVAGR
jgi:uncharacterized lipoprotein